MAKPIKILKSGKVQIACWENDYQGNKSYSYTLQKNYRTKEGEWKQTTSFGVSDLNDIKNGIDYILIKKLEHKNIDKDNQDNPGGPTPQGFEQEVKKENTDFPFGANV